MAEKGAIMRLSVLIPAYNPPGGYLDAMLASLTKQSAKHPGVEVIVVDDGSEKSLEWVERYPIVRWVRKENGGEGSARNRCLAEASGEYIQFFDADDQITDDCLDIIFENIDAGYDWVSYNWVADGVSGCKWQRRDTPFLNCAVWPYTFRRSFVEGVKFIEGMPVGCDTIWLDSLPKGGKHRHDPRVFYNYRWAGNEGSLCHRNLRGEFKK